MLTANLESLAIKLRLRILELSHQAKTQHIGSCLSCIDLLIAAYFSQFTIDPKNPSRDRIILSKGHGGLALYVTLCEKGLFDEEALNSFNKEGSVFTEHPSLHIPFGIEASTGSLGHGLPLGLGIAAGVLLQNYPSKVLVILSDGECNEGSVWEASLLAPKIAPNLIAVVDYNKWQATGQSDSITQLSPLKEKWEAFGWKTLEIDGHNITQIQEAYKQARMDTGPYAIIAHTVKGKGVSFMENNNNWHYRTLSQDEYQKARDELEKSF